MKSLSSVGIGLSLVFGCLLLAFVAELYYLFWWKKRISINGGGLESGGFNSPAKEFFHTLCFKRPSSSSLSSSRTLNPQQLCSSETLVLEPQQSHRHLNNSNKDLWQNAFEEENNLDTELMRLQQFGGPPRFLFTIMEETKEDLESEDGNKSRKGSRTRSLSDFFYTVETPYLTPLASPSYFTPPLTPVRSLFELATDAEFNKIKSSPPPTFQFLKNAEEKLFRRNLEEAGENGAPIDDDGAANVPSSSRFHKDEENDSFITIFVGKNKEKEDGEYS